jgi:hypothetical protein
MKRFILGVVLALGVIGHAQADSTNQVQTGSQAAVNVAASPLTQVVSYGADKVKTSEQAPSIGFSSSFSPDSCASGAGGSVGTFPVGLGINVPWSPNYCIALRVFERLQQAAAADQRVIVRDNARDASYAVLAEISPTIRGILSEHHLLTGNDAVQSDASGTVGLQSASTRIDDPKYASTSVSSTTPGVKSGN